MSFPFYGKQFRFTQPDGSTLEVKGWGDQHQAVFETLDGFTVIEDPASGFYEYADLTEGELKPLGVTPGFFNTGLLPMKKGLRHSSEVVRSKVFSAEGLPPGESRWKQRRENSKMALIQSMTDGGPMLAPPKRKTVGSYTGLCLLVQFPDVPGTIPQKEVDAFCNAKGYNGSGNNGSVYDYFYENSLGNLAYTNIIAPYYTAKHPRGYYTDQKVKQPVRALELIQEALNFHKANGFDFTRLSSDNENYVYALNVFYAGDVVNNWAKGLWPHSWHLDKSYPLAAGKNAFDYQITNMGKELTLGTFCHENGHMICDFPDLYDYGPESKGIGAYCLMCAGGNINEKNPVQVGAYLKFAAGWADGVTNLSGGMQGSLHASKNEFCIARKNEVEYYLFEHRRKTGRDASLPDEGLLIWHIDELGNNSNEQMTPARHYECSLLQADGQHHLERGKNYGDTGDCYKAPSATRLGSATRPQFQWWDGSPVSFEIKDISSLNDPMTFSTT
jgi:M6 family metalloprotease-like protein